MKYMERGGFQSQPHMRLTLLCTAMLLTLFWVSNFFFYFAKMGLTAQSVVNYYRGSDVTFQAPRSYESMLETTHFHLPIIAVVMLLLTHLLIFSPLSSRAKTTFILAAFGSALMNETMGWLVRFVHPGFAPLKIVSFLSLQLMLGYLLFGLVRYLLRGGQSSAVAVSK